MPEHIIQHLPAIYQAHEEHSLLTHLLAAFEKILLNTGERSQERRPPAIEELVDDIARYFDPMRTPAEFLPWLAGWAALTLRADLGEAKQREVISKIIPLYATRGTRRGIKDMVELFTGGVAEIDEPQDLEFQIHDHSTIARDTQLGGPPPHVFHVKFTVPENEPRERHERTRAARLTVELARAAIEMSKPAHTWYTMDILHPGESERSEGKEDREP